MNHEELLAAAQQKAMADQQALQQRAQLQTQAEAKWTQGAQQAGQIGSRWDLPDKNSPLSAFERGGLGALRYPDKQMKYLEGKFGEGNVQVNKMDENSSNFLVKDESGIHEVDPHGLMDIPNDIMSGQYGQALNRIKGANLKNTIGGAAQFLAEKGPLVAAASAGAAAAAPEGMAIGAMGGPFAPVTVPLGGLIAGGLGAMAAGGAESAAEGTIRMGMAKIEQATGVPLPYAKDLTAEDLSHQMVGDMIFSGQQELAAPFLNAGIKGSGKVLATALERAGDSPEAKTAITALLTKFSGMKEGLARAWAEAPKAVADYVPDAIKDKINGTFNLLDAQKAKVQDFFDNAISAKKAIGKQYDAIEKAAGDKTFDSSSALKPGTEDAPSFLDTITDLQKNKYLDADLNVVPKNPQAISRDTTGRNGALLGDIVSGFRDFVANKGQMSYSALRQFKSDMSNYIDGEGQASDGYLRKVATQIQTQVKNHLSQGLNEIDPSLSDAYGKLNSKYGNLMDGTLLEDMAKKSSDNKLDVFLRSLHKADGSYNSTMMEEIGNILGIDNPTKDILHMQAAKESLPWFQGKSLFGVPLPTGKMAQVGMAQGRQLFDDALSTANTVAKAPEEIGSVAGSVASSQDQDSVIGALKKFHSVYKALPEDKQQSFLSDPSAISSVSSLIRQSPQIEEDNKSQILKQAGAFQNSQFQPPAGP